MSVVRAVLGRPPLDALRVPQGVREHARCALLQVLQAATVPRVAEAPEATQRGHVYAGYHVSTRVSYSGPSFAPRSSGRSWRESG